ncbi:MAG: LysE family translocator [Gemmatirosa sp.]|nr:LysE family translocator [Gemmatirosa sp.]
MFELRTLLLFLAAGLALNVTPGPDMLYVAARSTGEGRRAGIVSALGIGAGTLVHIAALALGLSALLRTVPAAYDAVRYAGAAYLVWLGLRALLRRGARRDAAAVPPASLGRIFRQGVVTNVLNPKVALFFLAFLPQFVDPSRGSAVAQTVALGLLFDTTGTIVNVLVALAASRAAAFLKRGRAGDVLERVTGGVFVLLGMRLAFARR